MSTIVRETKETTIRVELSLEGGEVRVETPWPFLRHMLETLGSYTGLGLRVEAQGDLEHHVVEDSAIAVGLALAAAAPERRVRYAQRLVPIDDALVERARDLGDRPYYEGPLPSKLYDHWMRSFAMESRATLHLRVLRGTDRHHTVEAAFKALGLSLREALTPAEAIRSTKGRVEVRR